VATLVVMRSGVVEAEVELKRRDLRIGRSADNDVVLKDPTKAVSRYHAELRFDKGEYVLVDLNSQNGTWVDGHSIRRVDFLPGASALIGPYTLTREDPKAAMAASRPTADMGAPPPEVSVGDAGKSESREPGRPARAPRARSQASAGSQGSGPIAWLARQPKPLVFGGFVVFMVLLILVLQMLSPGSAPPVSSGKKTPTNEQAVANLLSEGKAFLDKGDATSALVRIEQALLIKPDDQQALELRMKALEQRRRALATEGPGASR
jgi:predicted component of type VI protein secretion system